MKYQGKRKSGADQHVDVYEFAMGTQEARLIHDLCSKFIKQAKGIFEAMPAMNRASNIANEISSNVPIRYRKKYIHSEDEVTESNEDDMRKGDAEE